MVVDETTAGSFRVRARCCSGVTCSLQYTLHRADTLTVLVMLVLVANK